MRIAIEGCTHGELEKTYETIKEIEEKDGRKVNPSPTKCTYFGSGYVNGCCNLAWHRWTCCCAAETSSQLATCPTWPAWPALTSTKRCAHSTSIIGVFEFRMAWTLRGISPVSHQNYFHWSHFFNISAEKQLLPSWQYSLGETMKPQITFRSENYKKTMLVTMLYLLLSGAGIWRLGSSKHLLPGLCWCGEREWGEDWRSQWHLQGLRLPSWPPWGKLSLAELL